MERKTKEEFYNFLVKNFSRRYRQDYDTRFQQNLFCTICQCGDNSEYILFRCNHLFHIECVIEMVVHFVRNSKPKSYLNCPCCRTKIFYHNYK